MQNEQFVPVGTQVVHATRVIPKPAERLLCDRCVQILNSTLEPADLQRTARARTLVAVRVELIHNPMPTVFVEPVIFDEGLYPASTVVVCVHRCKQNAQFIVGPMEDGVLRDSISNPVKICTRTP